MRTLGLVLGAALACSATGTAVAAVPHQATTQPPPASRTGWPQAPFGPAHNADNPFERVLSPSTVGRLGTAWSVPVSRPRYDLESSPTVARGVVYLATWDGHLVAADAGSGFPHWARTLAGGMFGSAPVDATTVYTWLSDGTIRAFRARDGRRLWVVSEPNGGGIPSSSLTQVGTVLYGVSWRGSVFARSATNGAQIWRTKVSDGNFSSPTVWRGEVLAIDDYDNVDALDARTGARLWTTHISGVNWNVTPAVGAGGLAFVVNNVRGTLVALDARTGKTRWTARLAPAGVFTDGGYVALSSHRVYLATYQDDVLSFRTSNGSLAWRRHVPGSAFSGGDYSQPVLANGVLWVAAKNSLVPLDAATGARLGEVRTAGIVGEPVVVDGRVYAAEQDAALHAYRLGSRPSIMPNGAGTLVRGGPAVVAGPPTAAERLDLLRQAQRR